ncbi:uncharacterized protein PAC_13409 [Phialocephala subalpina]|uniref:Uncharacterized protein n=1 Tax=Phialocephala subalpina TaxID=576137 RepID=A0A1L7XEQ6_9HELO|nr:uncharacterized protein PAC_13409 [Phialocephala subalpina]
MDGEGKKCFEKAPYRAWYRMVENYSRRTLTFEKDKLPAVAGIVEEFKSIITDKPLLGLWQGDLLTGLLWQTAEPTTRIEHTGIPSWSWASVNGPVNWQNTGVVNSGTPPKNQAEVMTSNIEWSGHPMTSQIKHATLKVRGRLKRAKLSKFGATKGNSFYLHAIDESISNPP